MVKNEVASRKFSTESWSSEIIEGQCTPRAKGEKESPRHLGRQPVSPEARSPIVLAKPMENTLYSEAALEAQFHHPWEYRKTSVKAKGAVAAVLTSAAMLASTMIPFSFTGTVRKWLMSVPPGVVDY
jgi:hypothetical protein